MEWVDTQIAVVESELLANIRFDCDPRRPSSLATTVRVKSNRRKYAFRIDAQYRTS